MQIFHTFFKIAKKHTSALVIYFSIYIFIAVLLSLTAKDSLDANFQSKALKICIQDKDKTEASRALCSYLASVHHVSADELDPEQLADQLYYRTLNYILILPEGFEKKLLSGETKQLVSDIKIPGSSAGFFVDQQITQYLQTIQLYLEGGFSLTDAISQTDESISSQSDVTVVSFSDESSAAITPIFYFYQYLPYILLLVLFVGLAPILVIENRTGVKERTLCSPLPFTRRNLELAGASILYSLFIWLLFMIVCFIIYGRVIFSYFSMLGMLNSFVYLLFAAGLTLLVSLFAPDDNVLNMMSNIFGLSMSFLCGVFVPQNMLSEQVLAVGRFLPAYWYIKANNLLAGFANEPFQMQLYLKCLGIQFLFAAAIFAVTLALSFYRKKRSQ